MSTIHDALKKVQDNMQPENILPGEQNGPEQPKTHNPFNPPPSAKPEVPDKMEAGQRKNGKNFLVILFTVLILCGLGFALTYGIDHLELFLSRQHFLPFKKQISEVEKNALPGNTIKVQGTIMMAKGRTAALINSEIYEVGGIVNGKKIKSIDRNTVVVAGEDGVEEILSVSNKLFSP
ncbi:MAG: hypothetical protein AB1650_05775 [Candidatus Omnitrophota bacterium]